MSRTHRINALAIVGLVCAAIAPSVHAQADLQITAMALQGQAQVGSCNKVTMTVRNFGNEFTGNATLDIALITFPSNTPNQNRASKSLFISPLQPGAQSSFTIDNVEFLAAGAATIQGVADSTEETDESNENNNTRNASANVSGSCYTPPPPPPTNQNCDIEATFSHPSGNTVPGNQSYTYQVTFTNKGTSTCNGFKVKLVRTNSTTCGGYGSQVGGSRAWQTIDALKRNTSATGSFTERKSPAKGTACLYLGYSPNNYSDANNVNHRPKKVITYQ
jgi:hypothetical protein